MVSVSHALVAAVATSFAMVQAAPAADPSPDPAHGGTGGRRPPPIARHPPPRPETAPERSRGKHPMGSVGRGDGGSSGRDSGKDDDADYNPRQYPPEYSMEIYYICLGALNAQNDCTRDDQSIDAWCLRERDATYLDSADTCARSYDANWDEFKYWLQPGRQVCYDFKRQGV